MAELVEQDRGEERHRVAEDQRQQGELGRVPPGDPEPRVFPGALVVVKANPAGYRVPGGQVEVLVLEAHDDLADHRVPGEDREAHHRADQERPRYGLTPDRGDQATTTGGQQLSPHRW
jgi:hypothetical protein